MNVVEILMSWIRLRTFFMTWDFKKDLNSSFFWSILHVLLKILSLFWNLLLFTIIYECRCNCSSVRLRGKCYYVNKVIKNELDCFSGVCCMSWPKYIPHFEICYYFRLLMVLLAPLWLKSWNSNEIADCLYYASNHNFEICWYFRLFTNFIEIWIRWVRSEEFTLSWFGSWKTKEIADFSGVWCISWPKTSPSFDICYYFRLLSMSLKLQCVKFRSEEITLSWFESWKTIEMANFLSIPHILWKIWCFLSYS